MNLYQVRAALQNTDRFSTVVEPRWLAEKILVAVDEAIEQTEQDKKFAERYAWLREQSNYPDWDWWANELTCCGDNPEEFDAVIDEAMDHSR